ncbi:gamma-mobile-trio integrase GmtZ [Photobacterium damselae]|uniref:gamma-mobile-trio integrase GmtZ n=1 Tax=Photobacterium damselae TaxID=38293 RepID=UPI000D073F9D|nr:integrase family protein [Photobacterium damselae]PSB83895.1 hypothetical protein C5F62_07085 [Photobacterium damselae subsp. damselae]
MKTTDYEFLWFIKKNGTGWETWRELASTWLHQSDYGVDRKRIAISRFLDEYLVPHFYADPIELFEAENQDYYEFLSRFEYSESYQVRVYNEVSDFIDWIIITYYSQPNDHSVMIPMFKNPFTKVSNPINKQESVYNALPYSYIKQLRRILCPVERGHFSDWSWAIEQSDTFMVNGRHFRDWQLIDEKDINKSDPDCVWRRVEIDKDRKIRINGAIRTFRKGEHFFVIWSPVRAMALYTKLQLPLRTYQVRMLDSGEADTWRYEQGQWRVNNTHDFVEGSEKRPWQKGVFHRIVTPDIGDIMTGMYINTNKTADKNKDELTRGYVIPWQHETMLYWLEKLRNWQEKYNPLSQPTSIQELDYKHFGSTKTTVQRNEIGDICFLFRDAAAPRYRDRKMPITAAFLNSLWLLLMTQLEADVYRQGHRLANESKVRFIDPANSRKTLFPLHSLRVSLITCYTIDGEIPTPVLSKLLVGHSRLIMTLHYTRVSPVAMAKKMQEAEAKIVLSNEESLQSFLATKSIEEIGLQAAYKDAEALNSVLRVRNPAGWQEKSIGVCLAGGNTAPVIENATLAGCWNGGEKLKKANRNQSDLYGPVPHGFENCIRCRWFITDIRYIHSLTAHFNNLSYHASESARIAAEQEVEQSILLDEEYFCEVNGEPFKKYESLHQLDRRIDKQKTDADEYCKDLVACFQVIRYLLKLEEQRQPEDTNTKVVALGTQDDISPYFSFIDTESKLRQLIQLCDDAEIYADLRDDLMKTPAINHRSNTLNTMLMKSGYMPFLMQLDDHTQLIAGNAMINAMLQAMDEGDKSKAMNQLASYLETEAYLTDAGLLDIGVKAIEAKTGINILRLIDLSNQQTIGKQSDG